MCYTRNVLSAKMVQWENWVPLGNHASTVRGKTTGPCVNTPRGQSRAFTSASDVRQTCSYSLFTTWNGCYPEQDRLSLHPTATSCVRVLLVWITTTVMWQTNDSACLVCSTESASMLGCVLYHQCETLAKSRAKPTSTGKGNPKSGRNTHIFKQRCLFRVNVSLIRRQVTSINLHLWRRHETRLSLNGICGNPAVWMGIMVDAPCRF